MSVNKLSQAAQRHTGLLFALHDSAVNVPDILFKDNTTTQTRLSTVYLDAHGGGKVYRRGRHAHRVVGCGVAGLHTGRVGVDVRQRRSSVLGCSAPRERATERTAQLHRYTPPRTSFISTCD